MDNKDLRSTLAALESKVDMLEAELAYLNTILVRCGFSEGINTLKETVEEMLLEDAIEDHNRPSGTDRLF